MKFRRLAFVVSLLVPLAASGCADQFASFGHGDGGGSGDDGGGGPGPGDDGGVTSVDGGGTLEKRSCSTTFTFKPDASLNATQVAVGGEWTGFDPGKTPMMGPDAKGLWTASVDLPPGAYAYKFVVTQPGGATTWLFDPSTSYTRYSGGVENSVVEVDDCKAPLLRFGKLDRAGSGTIHAEAQYVDGADGAGFDLSAFQVLLDDGPAPSLVVDSGGHITVDGQGLSKDKHRLTFRAVDKAGHHATDLIVPFWIEDQPFDFRDGVMYFAFTDRFRDGVAGDTNPAANVDPRANYEGGDYPGIQQVIESGYFDSLGVRTIWISPPNKNPDGGFVGTGGHLYSGYHGYWPTSGRDVQPRFGGMDALKSMIKAAHKRGIRVLIDSVLNHVHMESPYFQMHQNDGWFNPFNLNGQSCQCGTGPANGCGDWDSTGGGGNHGLQPRLTCWFEPYMPDLDYTNWDALTTMIDDALYFAREADVDGFRVDAVKHFLTTATTRLRGKLHDTFEHAQPLFYTVGETFTGDRGLIGSYIGPDKLQAQFDFPIYFAVRSTLADYSSSLRGLEQATHDSDAAFGDAPMSPFLGNHDVTRFLSEAAGQGGNDPWANPPGMPTDESAYIKLRLALSFVMTSPGVPLLYYGDEYGQPGAGDPDNRRFMKWDSYTPYEQATLDVAKKLGAARLELNALRRGGRQTLWIDDNLYVYARATDKEAAIVAINREWNPRANVTVTIPQGVPLQAGTVLHDRLGGPDVTVGNGSIVLNLPAHSSAVLAP